MNASFTWSMTFLQVVEAGSFHLAAEQLGISKAWASKQVSQLEQVLGVRLLHRSTRRLALTASGTQYLAYCQKLRQTMQEAWRVLGNQQAEIRGKLKMSAPTSLGVTFVAALLQAFQQQYPLVDIELDLSQTQHDLLAGQFDLALRAGEQPDPRLVAISLGALEEWVVAAPSTILQYGQVTTPAELVNVPCVINSLQREPARWQFQHEEQRHIITLPVHLAVNSHTALRHLVLAGAGYGRIVNYLVREDVAAGRLIRVLPDFMLPAMPLFLVYPPQQPMPTRLRALVDYLREGLAQHDLQPGGAHAVLDSPR